MKMNLSNTALVIARFNEDVTWLLDVPEEVRIFIYNKGNGAGEKIFYAQLPNIGREAHTYLHHIINQYNCLDEWILFAQAWPFDHVENLLEFFFHR